MRADTKNIKNSLQIFTYFNFFHLKFVNLEKTPKITYYE